MLKRISIIGGGLVLLVAVAVILFSYFKGEEVGGIRIVLGKNGRPFRQSVIFNLGPGETDVKYFRKTGLGSWKIKKIEFRLENLKEKDAELQATLNFKNQESLNEDWSELDKKIFCLEDENMQLKELTLMVRNSSDTDKLRGGIEVLAFREGCENWSGHIDISWKETGSFEDFNSKSQGSLSTVFTLTHDPYTSSFLVKDGGYGYSLHRVSKSLLAGCPRKTITKELSLVGDGEAEAGYVRLNPSGYNTYELKLAPSFGKSDRVTEITETEIYSCATKKTDTDREIQTLENIALEIPNEVFEEALLLQADPLSGKLKGHREFISTDREREVTVDWDMTRQ